LVVHSLMIKRALLALAAIPGVCFSLTAQETLLSNSIQPARLELNQASPSDMVESRATLGQTSPFRTLTNAWSGSGPLTLLDERLFSFPSAFGWVEAMPSEFLPDFTAGELPRPVALATLARESDSKAVDLLHKFDYVGGEVGVFYGKSTGKFSREVEQGYILGEVVDGNTHITVGGSYEHVSGRVPRIIGR
jgi:hypothetical protein